MQTAIGVGAPSEPRRRQRVGVHRTFAQRVNGRSPWMELTHPRLRSRGRGCVSSIRRFSGEMLLPGGRKWGEGTGKVGKIFRGTTSGMGDCWCNEFAYMMLRARCCACIFL